jgi:hypothetical protein
MRHRLALAVVLASSVFTLSFVGVTPALASGTKTYCDNEKGFDEGCIGENRPLKENQGEGQGPSNCINEFNKEGFSTEKNCGPPFSVGKDKLGGSADLYPQSWNPGTLRGIEWGWEWWS